MHQLSQIWLAAASVAIGTSLAATSNAHGFAYVFAGTANGVDLVAHTYGYTGTGGVKTVTVGIDPTSTHAAEMGIPVQNAIAIWNGLNPTLNNLKFGATNNIPSNQVDFESTVLHEMGHALGLSHPNVGDTSPANSDYTQSTAGPNGVFNFNAGADGVIGSSDDVRGDDINLNYFRTSNNDPFTIAGTVDSTTYSRNLANLPGGQLYSANASRDVSALLGYGSTEASLQQGAFFDEAQRTLGHDDVAGIRYAFSGLDHVAGNADDYAYNIVYSGLTTSANIVIDFDSAQTSFAVTSTGGAFINATNIRLTGANMYFTETPGGGGWFFNDVPVPEPTALAVLGIAGLLACSRRRRA